MGRNDWYRNTTWTEDIRKSFFDRLGRSRTTYNKAQYARIQASHLRETGKKQNIQAAIELLNLMIKQWPEPSQLATAYLQKALCFEDLGMNKPAIEAYRKSVKAEEESKKLRVGACLHFGWFVIAHGLKKYYDEVLSSIENNETLKEITPFLIWPIYRYKFSAIFAVILKSKGEKEAAQRFAVRALEAMDIKESPFRYHKKEGLVTKPTKKVVKQLKKIANK